MTKTRKRLAIVLSAAAAATAVMTATALAVTDTDDNISPANTSFTASSTKVTFAGTINFVSVTVTCTMSSISGTTPASGLGPKAINDPQFSNCTDNSGGTDTVKANHNNGSWTLTFTDSTNETENPDSTEGAGTTGDGLQLGIPTDGVTVTSTALPGCTVKGPNSASSINAGYDDVNNATFSNQQITTTGTGCSSGTSTMNGIYVSSPNIQDVS